MIFTLCMTFLKVLTLKSHVLTLHIIPIIAFCMTFFEYYFQKSHTNLFPSIPIITYCMTFSNIISKKVMSTFLSFYIRINPMYPPMPVTSFKNISLSPARSAQNHRRELFYKRNRPVWPFGQPTGRYQFENAKIRTSKMILKLNKTRKCRLL